MYWEEKGINGTFVVAFVPVCGTSLIYCILDLDDLILWSIIAAERRMHPIKDIADQKDTEMLNLLVMYVPVTHYPEQSTGLIATSVSRLTSGCFRHHASALPHRLELLSKIVDRFHMKGLNSEEITCHHYAYSPSPPHPRY